jgi:hypothetical protein
MQTHKLGMQVAAATPLCNSVDLLHPKPQADKVTVTPTMHRIKKDSQKYMSS